MGMNGHLCVRKGAAMLLASLKKRKNQIGIS